MSKSNAASLTGSLLVRKGAAAPSPFTVVPPEGASPPFDAEPSVRRTPVASPAAKVKRFTLRLSPDEHLRLRLASVYLGRSGQKLVLEAVNEHLARIAPELSIEACTRTFGHAHPRSVNSKS